MTRTLTLLDGPARLEIEVAGPIDRPSVAPGDLGWDLKPEGLCQGDICIPLRATTIADGRIALTNLAGLLARPVVIDAAGAVAALGTSAARRAEQMHGLAAPDFTLPDPQGNPVSLSDFGRRKRLLLAWSSW